MRCRTPFTFTNRKHHCRNCGNVFCGACSSKSIALPHLGITDAVRVDDGCYSKILDKDKRKFSSSPWDFSAPRGSRLQPRNARVEDSFDADLKKALEMSLEDAKAESVSGYVPSSKPPTNGVTKPRRVKEDDEDPELKAAIAASLQDMEEQKKKHAAELKEKSSKASAAPTAGQTLRNEYELTPMEAENINLFSTLVDRLQHQAPGTILREPQIQELYESIGKLRPKLARSYGETMSKHDTLLDLHTKLATVVRYYDRMLEERLHSTYATSNYAFSGQPAPMNSMYPNLDPQGSSGYAPQQQNMESYYTGNSAVSDPYGRPQSMYSSPPPQSQTSYTHQPPSQVPQRSVSMYGNDHFRSQSHQQQMPSSPYTKRQRQGSSSTASSQRAPSLKYRQPSSDQVSLAPNRQTSTYGGSAPQAPHQPSIPPTQDPATSYYYTNGAAPQPDPSSNLYPSLKSPPSEAPAPQNPYQHTTQPPQTYPSQQQYPNAHSQPPPPPPQSGWQVPPSQHQNYPEAAPQHPHQQSQASYQNLGPSMFPSAPTNQPISAQPPPQRVEESLIEL